MSFAVPDGNYYNTPQNFNKWANGSENANKAANGEKVDEFKMFAGKSPQTYPNDIKNFSQAYIDMWDKNGDGAWDKEEFVSMCKDGDATPILESEETKKAYAQFYEDLYKNLNIDDNKNSISSGEFAAHLYACDMDWENYAETGNIADSVDGKVDYTLYQEMYSMVKDNSAYNQLQVEKTDFYNYFYAEEEQTQQKNQVTDNVTNSTIEKQQKEESASESELPDGYSINDDKQILDKNGKTIGRVNITYADVTNDGIEDKITEYYLFKK